ncbi:hypothetical protein BJX70DRAFT_108321 [Aspergillus crustosus]
MSSDTPLPPVVQSPAPETIDSSDFLVELLVYNGAPFKDHWAYFIHLSRDTHSGVLIEAAGDPLNGFRLGIHRGHDISETSGNNLPTQRVPLQSVGRGVIDEKALSRSGDFEADQRPTCAFEESVCKVKAPGRSLRSHGDTTGTAPGRISQNNCQSWIIESADQLVKDGIFSSEVALYLQSIHQG